MMLSSSTLLLDSLTIVYELYGYLLDYNSERILAAGKMVDGYWEQLMYFGFNNMAT
jgi:hypothetical protein